MHNQTADFQCTFCDKAFTQAGTLQRHLQTHTGVLDFSCAHCDYETNNRRLLNRHVIRNHTHDYPHHCTVCQKGFTQLSHLECHLKTHTGVRDFACAHCNYKTNDRSHLKKHVIAKHTHDHPHHCPVCQKGFNIPDRMKKHIASNH